LSADDVPGARFALGVTRNDAVAVGTEAHAHDVARLSLEDEPFLPHCRVPPLTRVIMTGAGQPLAIETEAQTRPMRMSPFKERSSCPVTASISSPSDPGWHGQAFAVRAEAHAFDHAGVDRTVKVWTHDGEGSPLPPAGTPAWSKSVCFSPDGKRLASASQDRTVKIWDQYGQNSFL